MVKEIIYHPAFAYSLFNFVWFCLAFLFGKQILVAFSVKNNQEDNIAGFLVARNDSVRSVTTVSQFNPLNPNISMYILHTVFYTFSKVMMRRIC